jgi:hypothetical protein
MNDLNHPIICWCKKHQQVVGDRLEVGVPESVLDHFSGSIVELRDGHVLFSSVIDHFPGGIEEK